MKILDSNQSMKGFSLVEVTIAMAIAAVAMVTLMGLIPQGMNTMRDAGDLAIGGRIQQQILNELQMAEFETIDDFNEMVIYYDSQGEEIGDQRGGGDPPPWTVYSARIMIQPLLEDSEFIRPVVIQIAATGQRAGFDWDDESTRLQRFNHRTMVVKMGKVES